MSYLKTKKRVMSVAVAGACSWMVLPAFAQQAPEGGATKASSEDGTQVVTVTGFRAAAEDGLNIKRTSDGFVDAISADGLGRFPELNVGEALTRIPGIQLDRSEGDRTARVNLRGLPGQYTVTTVNGLAIADPNIDARGAALGTFSSDVFSRFVVNKSPNASDLAGGIAGNIDMQFSGALARKDGGDIKLSGEYNSLGKSTSPAITVKYNKHLTPDFAVFGNVVYKQENFRRDTVNIGYNQLLTVPNLSNNQTSYPKISGSATQNTGLQVISAPTAADPLGVANPFPLLPYYQPWFVGTSTTVLTPLAPGEVAFESRANNIVQAAPFAGTGTISHYGVQFPGSYTQSARYSKGENSSFSGGMEYRFNKHLKIDVTAFSADKNLNDAGSESVQLNPANGGRIVPDYNSMYTSPNGLTYIDKYDYFNPLVNSSNVGVDNRRNQVRALSSNLVWTNSDWRVVSTLSASKGRGIDSLFNSNLQLLPAGPQTSDNLIPYNGVFGSIDNGMGISC